MPLGRLIAHLSVHPSKLFTFVKRNGTVYSLIIYLCLYVCEFSIWFPPCFTIWIWPCTSQQRQNLLNALKVSFYMSNCSISFSMGFLPLVAFINHLFVFWKEDFSWQNAGCSRNVKVTDGKGLHVSDNWHFTNHLLLCQCFVRFSDSFKGNKSITSSSVTFLL